MLQFVLYNYHRLSKGMGKLKQLKFRTDLAKLLIGGSSTSVSTAQSSKFCKIEAYLLEEGNAGKHFIDKIKGSKKNLSSVRGWVQKLLKVAL